jgi:hypothetical protein
VRNSECGVKERIRERPARREQAFLPAIRPPDGPLPRITHHAGIIFLFSHVKERRLERQAEARQGVRTVKTQPHFLQPNGGHKKILA